MKNEIEKKYWTDFFKIAIKYLPFASKLTLLVRKALCHLAF